MSTPYASRKTIASASELDVAGDDELVGRLDGLPRTGRADVHDGLADGVQDRPG